MDANGFRKGFGELSKTSKRLVEQYNRQVDVIRTQQVQVDKLRAKLEAIKSGDIVPASLKRMETELKNVTKECDIAKTKYDSFSEKFMEAELELNFATSSGDTARIGEAQNVLVNLENESMVAGDKLSNLQSKASVLEEKIKQVKLNPGMTSEASQITNNLGVMESKLQTSKDKANNLKDELKESLNQKGDISSTLEDASSKIGSLGSKLKSVFSKGGNPLKSMSDKISNLGKKVEHFGKRITGLISSALIFNVLSNGLRNLTSNFGSLLNSNGQFSSSLNQIKANLMTAFAPIYNFVLPAINALMSALSSITGSIATFVSGLFGKTVDQSRKSASALSGQAKAYDKVGKSAKNAEGNISGFDKLEVIGGGADSSVSGGGEQDGIDFSGQMEQSSKLLDFLNQIKDLISNGNFFDVGMVIADSINNLLNSIDVVGFTDKISSILQGCVQVFNGFVIGLDWALLGTKFSQLVVGLTGAVASAIKSIDWNALAMAINNFIASIDLASLTTNIISIFTNALVGLSSLVTSINWTVVGQKLSEAIISGLNTIENAIGQINWENVGNSIKRFLCGINWGNILVSVAKVIIAAGAAFFDTLDGLLGADTGARIGIIISAITGALATYKIVSTAVTLANTLLGTSFTVALGPVLAIGAAIGVLIAVILLCIKHWDDIKAAAIICWELIKQAWSKVSEWFNNSIVQPIKNLFVGMWNALKDGAKNAWEGIKSVFSSVTNWFKDVFSKAWQAVKNVFSTGGKIFDGIKDGIASVFKTVVNGIIGGINKVISVPFKAINGMLNTIRNVNILGVSPFKSFWKQNPLSVPQIPMLAQGAVIPPNAKFLAMLGDQKNGRNLEAPESLIRQIVREESGNGNKEFILNLKAILECDKKQFGEISFEGIRIKEQQNGKRYFLN